MIFNYFKTAWRSLWNNRRTNAINLAGLSIGMTAAVLIFIWVQNELSFDTYQPGADRIYRVSNRFENSDGIGAESPFPLAALIRSRLPEVEVVSSARPAYNTLFRLGEEFFHESRSAWVDSSWFTLFHYDLLRGNIRACFQHPFSLAISQSKAKKYFGEKDPIGQTLRMDTIDYVVRAVVADPPANTNFPFDVMMPIDAYLATPGHRKYQHDWNDFDFKTFVRLRPAARPGQVNTSITGILHGSMPNSITASLTPLRQIHFESNTSSFPGAEHGEKRTVYILAVLGIILLIIACVNYVNLSTARANLRAKEVSVRKIMGAGRKTLFIQFMLESLIMSGLALLITLVLVQAALPFFRELTEKAFSNPFLSPNLWTITGGTLLAATLLNGVYPALLLSSFQPLNSFKGFTVLRWKDVFFRKSLVVLQFTFSIILLISTLVIHRQLNYIQKTNPGYDRSQLFYFNLPIPFLFKKSDDERAVLLSSIKNELLHQASITGVTLSSESIVDIGSSSGGGADFEGHDTSDQPTIHRLYADEDYQKVFQLQMQEGRWFTPDRPADAHNFILNQTAVAELHMREPVIGRLFRFNGDTGVIVGVVRDFHFASLHEKIAPLVVRLDPSDRNSFFVKTQGAKADRALAAAHTIWKRYTPDKPFDYNFVDEQFDALYKSDRKVSTLITLFSAIAILISCMGLFGLAAFTAEQRTKEIGIRKVLGATVTSIVTLLSMDFIRLVLLSIVIATPIAWWAMHQWLQDFAYHIPVTAWFFLSAGSLAVGIALATISFQSVRAAMANPVKNLRTE